MSDDAARIDELERDVLATMEKEPGGAAAYLARLATLARSVIAERDKAVADLRKRTGWQTCSTHGRINADVAWGCPECVTEMRADLRGAREALADALNYWEPPCESMECDKGYHVEQLKAYKRANAALSERQEGRDGD